MKQYILYLTNSAYELYNSKLSFTLAEYSENIEVYRKRIATCEDGTFLKNLNKIISFISQLDKNNGSYSFDYTIKETPFSSNEFHNLFINDDKFSELIEDKVIDKIDNNLKSVVLSADSVDEAILKSLKIIKLISNSYKNELIEYYEKFKR